ncbi:Uncharacterised protein [Mycobacteroides abscessus subsp. abscessus]|nr:Uncharacterised protein [Mycobacteroides abscessus subsp. abscessus]
MRLEHVGALRELLIDDVPQGHQPAAVQQLVGQPLGVGHAGAQHRDRDPDAEHAEPVQQRGPGDGVHRQRIILPGKAIRRQHGLGQGGGAVTVQGRELLQGRELTLLQGARGQRQQPRYRDDGLADAGPVQLRGEPGGHLTGRHHRVDASGPDLVGARCDPDDAEGTRATADEFPDLLEQRDVRRVEGAQQEDHGVHPRHAVSWHQELECAVGDITRQRRRPRCVDDGRLFQFGCGPLHIEVDDVPHIGRALRAGIARQVEGQAVTAGDRHVGTAAVPMVGGDAGRHAMAEPGDQAGGLGGVSGRNLLAHKRIHERRLAGLEGAGQGDADRLIEPAADPVQFGQGLRPVLVDGIGPVGRDDAAQDGADACARAHCARAGVSFTALSMTWRRMFNCRSSSRTRLSRSPASICAAARVACSDSLSERVVWLAMPR